MDVACSYRPALGFGGGGIPISFALKSQVKSLDFPAVMFPFEKSTRASKSHRVADSVEGEPLSNCLIQYAEDRNNPFPLSNIV